MTTLRELNKDRRYQLTPENIEFIHKAYHQESLTMAEIASILWISRQRIGQVLDIKGTRAGIIARQVAKNKTRYNEDGEYKAKFLQSKRESYKYKASILSM